MKSGPVAARGVLVAGIAALTLVSACGAPAPTAPTAAPTSSAAAAATAEKALADASAEPTALPSVDPSVVPDAPAANEATAEPTAPAVAPPAGSPYATLLGKLDQSSAGTIWGSCDEHPATAGSVAEAWCDNDDPALALKVIFNDYTDPAALDASIDGVYQQATGDTAAGCETGGRALEKRQAYRVACGFVVDDGTTYYSLAWESTDKVLRGQVYDPDPALVFRWWNANTPF